MNVIIQSDEPCDYRVSFRVDVCLISGQPHRVLVSGKHSQQLRFLFGNRMHLLLFTSCRNSTQEIHKAFKHIAQ